MSLYSAVCKKFMDKVFGQKNAEINEQMSESQLVEVIKIIVYMYVVNACRFITKYKCNGYFMWHKRIITV